MSEDLPSQARPGRLQTHHPQPLRAPALHQLRAQPHQWVSGDLHHDITMMRLISDYFSYVPTIPGPPHSPGNNSYQVKQQADYILCQIFMLIYLQAGSPHHMAPHQNSFVSKVGSEFEFYISISGLIPRTVRHFKGREDSNIRLLLTLLRNLICQEFPKVIV